MPQSLVYFFTCPYSPVAVLGLLGHACEWWLQAAQVIVELAGVTQHQQMLVLVFLTDATAAETHYVKQFVRRGWLLTFFKSWEYRMVNGNSGMHHLVVTDKVCVTDEQ